MKSVFHRRFGGASGSRTLMEDLGRALARGDSLMLGGGNPSRIPRVEELLRARMREIVEDADAFGRAFGQYDPPQGDPAFIDALADMLRRECGWQVSARNIALTTGSQSAFFALFNLFAGDCVDGIHRRILFPLTPEYIGYADLGLSDGLLRAFRPGIQMLDHRMFKYRVDFDALRVDADVGALCVSRPTNPTGNVLTDDEIDRLARIAAGRGLRLVIDNAYGVPFPGILFTGATPVWTEDLIVCMSLSKLGLPAVRTGIVIAAEEVIDALTGVTAATGLAPSSVGPALMVDMVRSGRITQLAREVIGPYYRARMQQALEWLHAALDGCDYRVHVPEGAIFLWLWLPGLPVSSQIVYERLKERGVLVLSGHWFFPGLDEPWAHRDECLRLTYSQDPDVVRRGIAIMGEEIRRLCDGAGRGGPAR
ncbi:MAG: valine--pyruvate transaminase [Gammaproteobacteria bacterium]